MSEAPIQHDPTVISIHFNLPSAEGQRYLEEFFHTHDMTPPYDPTTDTYSFPAFPSLPFPIEVLKDYCGEIVPPGKP